MQKFSLLLFTLVLLGVGCLDLGVRTQIPQPPHAAVPDAQDASAIIFPVRDFIASYHFVRKGFGQYVEDRFRGYHVGLDIEVMNENISLERAKEIPVYAIADGLVLYAQNASGYGGVMVIKHHAGILTPTAVYGHIDLSSARFSVGDSVQKGDMIAFLGEEASEETDGERQHLHFALYDDDEDAANSVHIQGYETTSIAVDHWINPLDYLREFGPEVERFRDKSFSEFVADYPSSVSDQYRIDFEFPETWGIEYVPSLNAINLYDLYGEGIARERSQIFIRYFDASDFLTLSTVTIHSVEELVVGKDDYVARRYDIQKKDGVPDFIDQPSWRSRRHMVTDFRGTEGQTRYYVVAANPELDPEIYERVLATMSR